jgi:hypothetical protein
MAKAKRRKDKKAAPSESKAELWAASRSGSHAHRGFRYQDRVATEVTVEHLVDGTLLAVVPEGLDDISLETTQGAMHIQAKSRRAHRGPFSVSELRSAARDLAARLVVEPTASVVVCVERAVDGLPMKRLGAARGAVEMSDRSARAVVREVSDREAASAGLERMSGSSWNFGGDPRLTFTR